MRANLDGLKNSLMAQEAALVTSAAVSKHAGY
jgi:hypothetical protein